MTPQEVEFLRRLVAERPIERRSGLAHLFFKNEALGLVRGTKVMYREPDYLRATGLLQSRGFGLESPHKGFARSQAPSGGSEKSGARAVTQDLVAVRPNNMDVMAPIGGFLAMPWQAAVALKYEALLVCENMETFLELDSYRWLGEQIGARPVLALFRGTVQTFGTYGAAKLIAGDNRPTLAFFDFDPKGLAMAAALPRREALCLPAWEQLKPAIHAARRDHLYTNSFHVSRAQLDKETDPEIALAWSRMQSVSRGLNQEGFPR